MYDGAEVTLENAKKQFIELMRNMDKNADCDSKITLHVDEFLHTDDEVNKLTDNGEIRTHYCLDCGSRRNEPLILVSHSMSRDTLYYIFDTLLPTLKGKTVLDVG